MMWIDILLILFSHTRQYDDFVQALNDQGCRVYDVYYVACPSVSFPPCAVQIPDDAVEVILPR